MYYVMFGDAAIYSFKTEKEMLAEMALMNDAGEFWNSEPGGIAGSDNAFVVVKGDIIRVEEVWQIAKEEKK